MSNLNPAEIVALNKVVTAAAFKKASGELDAGEHQVDFLVQISGKVTKGADYEQNIVAKADPWTMLAVALSHLNGVTVESIVKEALTADPELIKSIKVKAKDAIESLKEPTLTNCQGKVTTKVSHAAA